MNQRELHHVKFTVRCAITPNKISRPNFFEDDCGKAVTEMFANVCETENGRHMLDVIFHI